VKTLVKLAAIAALSNACAATAIASAKNDCPKKQEQARKTIMIKPPNTAKKRARQTIRKLAYN
jgi:hypothetical protein